LGNDNPIKLARCIRKKERINGVRKGSANPEGTIVGREVHNAPDVSQSQLADQMNISLDQLKRYKQLLKLIPELQDLVESDDIKPTKTLPNMVTNELFRWLNPRIL
jgi:hypothetical protein